jgi:hypothetical protein
MEVGATAPWKVLPYSEGHILMDVDGGISRLGDDTIYHPFPISLTNAVVINDVLVGTWVDHELRLARMAALDLNSDFEHGPSRGDLRAQGNSSHHQVAGALWSHTVESEPLAICANNEMIVFALWKRGIYAIDKEANELWRIANPDFKEMSKLPRGNEIIAITIDDTVNLWTRGGGCAKMSCEDGTQIENTCLPIIGNVTQVFRGDIHLLCTSEGEIWGYDGEDLQQIALIDKPIRDAVFDDIWRFLTWEGDLILEPLQKNPRYELPVQLLKQGDDWMVIDNQGMISPFMD